MKNKVQVAEKLQMVRGAQVHQFIGKILKTYEQRAAEIVRRCNLRLMVKNFRLVPDAEWKADAYDYQFVAQDLCVNTGIIEWAQK